MESVREGRARGGPRTQRGAGSGELPPARGPARRSPRGPLRCGERDATRGSCLLQAGESGAGCSFGACRVWIWIWSGSTLASRWKPLAGIRCGRWEGRSRRPSPDRASKPPRHAVGTEDLGVPRRPEWDQPEPPFPISYWIREPGSAREPPTPCQRAPAPHSPMHVGWGVPAWL